MEYKIDFNNRLGHAPVSLYITVDDKLEIFNTWDTIQSFKLRDIIFYGNLLDNIKEFNFLNSRLIGNSYHVSCFVDKGYNYTQLEEIIQNLISSRLIIEFESDVSKSTYFKNFVNLLKHLSINDIIILNPTSLKELIFIRQYFIEKEIKAKILLNKKSNIKNEDLIEQKIYDIFIY